ncbi:MAG: hypothetical protein ABSA69_10340 [Verrucomicrobiota bacterium]|jgi:hypothetical protein
MKEIITDSLRYWESRRVAFNGALALVVAASFFYHHEPLAGLTWEAVAGLLLAAVTANVLYSAVYAADLLVQMSEFQQPWRRHRWLLLVAGTTLAAALFLLHE